MNRCIEGKCRNGRLTISLTGPMLRWAELPFTSLLFLIISMPAFAALGWVDRPHQPKAG